MNFTFLGSGPKLIFMDLVRCGSLPSRFGPGMQQPDGTVSKKHPVIPGFKNVNVSTGGSGRFRFLSPMKLGPFQLIEKKVPLPWYPNGIHPGFQGLDTERQVAVVHNFEGYWQSSKIYNIDVANGQVQKTFFERRARMVTDPKPYRRSLPKAKGYPVSSYFDGQLYSYVSSRPIYIRNYEILVSLTPQYQELKQMVESGERVQILGYDGRDPESGLPYGANPITYEGLEKELYNPKFPFGHELVLCGMLLNLKPWENFDSERARQVDAQG